MRKTVRVVRDMDRWRQLISEYGRLQQLLGHTPQSRGQRFNTMIAELLRCWDIQATANVRAAGEVDVAFAIDGVRFVVEAKWERTKADTGRVAKLQKRVRQRLSGTYGVFLSVSGYTPEALADVADGDRLEVLLLSSEHWEAMLGGLVPPQELFNLVRDRASFYGEPYTPLSRLFASAEVPGFSFGPPSEMTDGPLLAAVDGVDAQVVLSGIESGQLGVACHRKDGLLVTTERGVLDVDLESCTAEIAVPVPDCRRNVLPIEDGSIVFLRQSGVGRFHGGRITTIGGGLSGNSCLCRHPDGSVWVFDNGGRYDNSASVTRLDDRLGHQQRHEIVYPPANAFTSAWLSDDALLTVGHVGYLVSSPTTGPKSRHPESPSNPMGLLALDETAFLTVGDSVSLRRTEIDTWSSQELARFALRPSVAELASAANGDLYLAAYHDTAGHDRMSFAVVRVRLPSELGGLELGTDFVTPRPPAASDKITSSPIDDAVRVLADAQQQESDRGYRDALECVPSLPWHALEGLAACDFDIPRWLTGWRNGWRDIELGDAPVGARVAGWLPVLADHLGSVVDPMGHDRWSFTPTEPYIAGFARALREAWAKERPGESVASDDMKTARNETAHRVGDDVGTPRPGPPEPLPKRMNAVLRLFDAPVYRDWLFWFMLAWAAIDFVSVLTLGPPSGLPKWLTAVIGAAFFALACGIIPAWIRLLVRRRRRGPRRTAAKTKAGK
ncbi:restriction endonuclease [Amycolatopsis mediterranei]|uniref:restriction endonuclease n=1 Tax=Amycolatopsis mediterranei TaxID=33910 RepID=UPI0034167FB8